ncbi:MAG: hypothetical protein K2L51_07685 [Clostridiales bacterium]|nr:hypothetical protein [Clostridiales bacterium]
MVKFEGENGFKIAKLLSAIREQNGFTYKQSVDYFVRAVTDQMILNDLDCVIYKLKKEGGAK